MKRTLDEINRGLKIRQDRLDRLKSIGAPVILRQNESHMIDELTIELNNHPVVIQEKRRNKLDIINKLNENDN
jgi:hypothetical protein